MTITVRLNAEEQHQLEWLLKDLNREPKGYRDQTISDIVRLAINNEWANYNVQHIEDDEKNLCDEMWLNRYDKLPFE